MIPEAHQLTRAFLKLRDMLRENNGVLTITADALSQAAGTAEGRAMIRNATTDPGALLAAATEAQTQLGIADRDIGKLAQAIRTAHAGEKA